MCLVLTITSSTAFLRAGKIANIVRAYDTLASIFPAHPIHIAAKSSDMDHCRSLLVAREKQTDFTLCDSLEPSALARAIKPLWSNSESVLIHDASRPFVNQEQFERVLIAFVDDVDAVRPAMPFTETLKILNADSVIQETLDRSTVLRISTPEIIRTSAIEVNGPDSGWFLPINKNARIEYVAGNPSGLRINSQSDADLMELQQG